MKVVIINTSDYLGGASRAAYSHLKSMNLVDVETKMVVKNKVTNDPCVKSSSDHPIRSYDNNSRILARLPYNKYIEANRTDLSNTFFNFPYPGYPVDEIDEIKDADIINFHWIANFQSPWTVEKIVDLGKPIVWSLHDEGPYTGGCHYTAGCEKYRYNCKGCPQIIDQDPLGIAEAVLKDKIDMLKGADLTVVAPSNWLLESAKKSKIFKNANFRKIQYGLDLAIFNKGDKKKAREIFGVKLDQKVIIFGTEDGNEKRKGFVKFIKALEMCKKNAYFNNLIELEKLVFLVMGQPNSDSRNLGLPIIFTGRINNDEKLADFYRAGDFLVLPSLEDNMPLTMLEPMACGTPVIAFAVGGMKDVIVTNNNGILVDPFDVRKLSKAIVQLLRNDQLREEMSENTLNLAQKNWSLEIQGTNYKDLYLEILKDRKPVKKFRLSQKKQRQNRDFLEEMGRGSIKIFKDFHWEVSRYWYSLITNVQFMHLSNASPRPPSDVVVFKRLAKKLLINAIKNPRKIVNFVLHQVKWI